MQVNIQSYDAGQYYASQGPLFSMVFDMMLFNQQYRKISPVISWRTMKTTIFPGIDRIDNIAQICNTMESSPINPADELPLVPLYYQTDISLARVDMCGVCH